MSVSTHRPLPIVFWLGLCEMLTPLRRACCVSWRTCSCVYMHRKHAHSPPTTPHAISSTHTTCAVGGMVGILSLSQSIQNNCTFKIPPHHTQPQAHTYALWVVCAISKLRLIKYEVHALYIALLGFYLYSACSGVHIQFLTRSLNFLYRVTFSTSLKKRLTNQPAM